MRITKHSFAHLIAFLAILWLSGCSEPTPTDPIAITISNSSGDLVFSTRNNTAESLTYSGQVYANPPNPKGDFFIDIVDDAGKPVSYCQAIDRHSARANRILAPTSSADIREEKDGLFRGFCLDRNRTYRARLLYWRVTGPDSVPSYSSNWAKLSWR